MIINKDYEILNSSGEFVDFLGVEKSTKDVGLKITLENRNSIIVSEDHLFLANGKNIHANSLFPNNSYITTQEGDFYVKSIERVRGGEFYDIVDSEDYDYYANGILNHNCSFLGSGDNFIAEEFIQRIEEDEMKPPVKQEYTDKNFWIWEDPKPLVDYIMAIDASAGHGEDNSTINILKIEEIIREEIITKNGVQNKVKVKRQKAEQVAEYYGKVSPQLLAEIAYQFGKRYNNALAVVDITGGYGVQTIEKLYEIGYPEESIHYAEISHKPSRDRLQGYIKKGQRVLPDGTVSAVDLVPGFFIGNNRPSVLLEFQRSVHMGDIIVRSVRTLNEMKTFVTVQGNRVADHKRSFHDDSLMGIAIGLFVLNFEMSRFKANKGSTKKMLDALINVNDKDKMRERMANDQNTRKIKNPNMGGYIDNSWLFKK